MSSLVKNVLKSNNKYEILMLKTRSLTDASSISDRAFFPGYKGEFSTSLEFIYPENNPQIQCYRVMNRKGVILDAKQDPMVFL